MVGEFSGFFAQDYSICNLLHGGEIVAGSNTVRCADIGIKGSLNSLLAEFLPLLTLSREVGGIFALN